MLRRTASFACLPLLLALATGCPAGKSATDNVTQGIATPPTLPSGTVGQAYTTTLSTTGIIGTITWALTAGSLPPGLTLDPAGVISGTPTAFVSAAAPARFTIKMQTETGYQLSQAFTMSVALGTPQVVDAAPIVVGDSGAAVVANLGGVDFDNGGRATPGTTAQFAIAWDDTTNGAANRDVFRRPLDTAGAALAATAAVIPGGEAATQSLPGIAFDGINDRHLLAWGNDDGAGTRSVRGAILAEDYTVLVGGASFAISATAVPLAAQPVVAAYGATNGISLVAWQDDLAADVIKARTVTAAGVVGGADITISTDAAVDNRAPAVAWDTVNNQFLVVWAQFNGAGAAATQSTIRGRFVSGTGVLGTAFTISAASAVVRQNPSVTWNAVTQRFIAAWSEQAAVASTSSTITGQIVQPNGALDAGFAVPNTTSSLETTPVVLAGTDGIGLLAWVSNRTAANGLDLYMAKLDLAGNLGAEAALFAGVDETTLVDQAQPRLAFDSINKLWLCVFGSFNNFAAPGTSKIKALRVIP